VDEVPLHVEVHDLPDRTFHRKAAAPEVHAVVELADAAVGERALNTLVGMHPDRVDLGAASDVDAERLVGRLAPEAVVPLEPEVEVLPDLIAGLFVGALLAFVLTLLAGLALLDVLADELLDSFLLLLLLAVIRPVGPGERLAALELLL